MSDSVDPFVANDREAKVSMARDGGVVDPRNAAILDPAEAAVSGALPSSDAGIDAGRPIAGPETVEPGIIVSDIAREQPGQIRLSRFLVLAANQMAGALSSEPPPHLVDLMRNMLGAVANQAEQRGQSFEGLLRKTMTSSLAVSTVTSVQDLLDGCRELARKLMEFADIGERALQDPDALSWFESDASDEIASIGLMAASLGTGGWAPPLNDPRQIGKAVHLLIQAHYLMTHAGNIVLTDYFLWTQGINLPDRKLTTIAEAVRMGRGTIFERLGRALQGRGTGIFRIPDILDFTTHELYEITTLSLRNQGEQKMQAKYLGPLADYFSVPLTQAVTGIIGSALEEQSRRTLIFVGGTTWSPLPLYFIPPDLAVITIPNTVPGLILYAATRLELPKVPEFLESLKAIGEGLALIALIAVAVVAAPVVAGAVGGAVAGGAGVAEALATTLLPIAAAAAAP
jgi:hypothetical protein